MQYPPWALALRTFIWTGISAQCLLLQDTARYWVAPHKKKENRTKELRVDTIATNTTRYYSMAAGPLESKSDRTIAHQLDGFSPCALAGLALDGLFARNDSCIPREWSCCTRNAQPQPLSGKPFWGWGAFLKRHETRSESLNIVWGGGGRERFARKGWHQTGQSRACETKACGKATSQSILEVAGFWPKVHDACRVFLRL